ncbi:Serine protease inhibitor A3C, partial [Lemmus lemmus]
WEVSLVGINRPECASENSTPGGKRPHTLNSAVTDTGSSAAKGAETMNILVALVLLVAGFCPAVLCQPDGTLGSNTELQEDQNDMSKVDSQTLASINTDFALSLYKELALMNPDKNIVFSPLSISAALAVLSLGASNNTLQEILEGLKFNLTETPEADIHRGFGQLLLMLSQPNDQVQISIGSTMFVEKRLQILAEFKEKARALYQAEASSVDFQQPHEVTKLINDYVRKQTQGKIKDLISGLDRSALMVLVNYIYFKGKWRMPFYPQRTHESNFYLDNKRTVKVPMMQHQFLTTPYFRDEELSCTVVELKYTGNASALFILPDQRRMQQVEASLQPETLRKWRDSLRPRKIDELSLPKFSISTAYSLESILPQLGIRELFSKQADLSGITGTKDLSISQVVHKAVLDVAETGTEAAAATGMRMLGSALIRNPLTVNFNRPFLMIIAHTNTQTSLFMAKVTNPKGN